MTTSERPLPPADMRARMAAMVRAAQERIVTALGAVEPKPFVRDAWERAEGGGGLTCVVQDGEVFEKAGVATSVVFGTLPLAAAQSMRGMRDLAEGASLDFYATGVSLVLHPHNPMAPTVHANYRYFERGPEGAPEAWWFGGGADLTPSYLFEEDAAHFHRVHREVCDAHDPAFYPRFKAWCDEYFRIAHRGESRGVGGIFFDDLHDRDPERLFAFSSDCAAAFVPAYVPILERRWRLPFEPRHKTWQALRRGRYVEFNLVYDRGTVFGLRTGGRIESILMSLPLEARWEYGHEPEVGSEEARLLEVLRTPRDWASAE
jgi:coproporphyrinogen III oxidase